MWRSSPRISSGILVAMLFATVGLFGCGASEVDSTSASGDRGISGGQVQPPVQPTEDNVPPSTPSGVSAFAIAPDKINLTWSASTDNIGVDGYSVFRDGVLVATLGNVTTYQSTGLSPSTTYSHTVLARDAAGNVSGQSPAAIATTPPAPDTTPPSVPSGLVATAVSAIRINLSWSASRDDVAVTGYRIFRGGAILTTVPGNVTEFQDNFLLPGTTYVYTVQAFDGSGNASAQSAAVSATTSSTADTTPPTTPTGLTANAVSPFQVNLNWLASTDNDVVASYRVYRNGALIATVASTSFQNTGLTPSTTYSYNVDAVDATGNVSGLSTAAAVVTPAAPDTTPPTAPTGLSASAASPSQINLSWNAATDNVAVTGYRVFRNGALVADLGNVTTYQDLGLSASTTYSYRVRALDSAGNVSAQSTAASATTPALPDTVAPTTPTALTASAASDTRIDLNWVASTDNVAVTGYRIYRGSVFLTAVGNVTTYADTGLSPSTPYSYNVDAIDAAGNASGISNIAIGTTLAVDTATLTWDPVIAGNLAGYRVYYGTAPGTYIQAPGAGLSAGTETTYTVTGLTRGTRYYFVVTAVDTSNEESSYSNEVSKDIQ